MPNLNIIRQGLLAARGELEEELATVDRVLQALGQPGGLQRKSEADKTREPSKELVESVSKILRESFRPLRNEEIATRTRKSNRTTGRALTFLKRQGKVAYERNDQYQVFWRWVKDG